MKTIRLGPGNEALAAATFSMLTAIFEEPPRALSPVYVAGLLRSQAFWALTALDDSGTAIGGLTAHALPMTRSEATELFVFDLAVRADWQRRGVGRRLVQHLRDAGAAEGISVAFVAADDEDDHALEFYRAIGGSDASVTMFTFAPDRSHDGPLE